MNEIRISYDKKTTEEKKQIYHMYQEIFEDPEAFARYYFDYCYPVNRVLKLVKEEQLAAMLHLNPYRLSWNGEEFPVSYIVAVATDRRYRRQGMMAKLLQRAFDDLFEEGQLFTYLIPANDAYYTPFDFTYVMDWQEAGMEVSEKIIGKLNKISVEDKVKTPDGQFQAPDKESGKESLYEIQVIDESLYEKTKELLNAKRGENFDLWIHADKYYVKRQDEEMKSEDGGLYGILKSGKIEGFFAATLDFEMVSCTNLWVPKHMTKEELEKLLFDYFQKEKIELIFPGECPIKELSGIAEPKIMARIICLQQFLEKMNSEREDSLILEVEDTFLTQNQVCFLCNTEKDGTRIEKTTEKPEWKIKIRELTMLLFGYASWENILLDAPEHTKNFFENLHKLCNISITEQV